MNHRFHTCLFHRCLAVALGFSLLGGFGLATTTARADEARRSMEVRWSMGSPVVAFSAQGLLREKEWADLRSGLPQTVVVRTVARSGDHTLAQAAQVCRVTYDLWEESFQIEVQSPRGNVHHQSNHLSEVLSRCLEIRGLPLDAPSAFERRAGGMFHLQVLVEFNPMSQATVEKIRRWLAQPGGRHGENDAFFGSFVSVFVQPRVGKAQRTLRFRTLPVPITPRPTAAPRPTTTPTTTPP